jgi:acyl carrier protein
MQRSEIVEKLKDVLQMALGDKANGVLENCTEDSNLVTDLGLNSIGILYLVIAIEEFFAIQFNDVSFSDFQTVGDVVSYIEQKKAE